MSHTFRSTLDTQLGPFTILVDADGAVLAAGWTAELADLLPQVHKDLRGEPIDCGDLGPATRAVRAYHDGDLGAPDAIAVRQHTEGAFLAAAWQALRKVAPGEPVSYTELAELTGNPLAVRAAAQACARNAAALFVPCHRIIRADGGLGGFRWGLEKKRWLLAHESRGGSPA
jgi:methylated-DNA-[protein]-cysteine S-methyltransferase